MERDFQSYGNPLEILTAFSYLVQVVAAGENDWPSVVDNLQKARNSWGRLSQILSQGGWIQSCWGIFEEVTQAALLFRAEMWVLTPRMERDLISLNTGSRDSSQGGSQ